ncbi:MAG: acyl carrier protein [Bacteroidia bacterium]|nr:acyl carrier protein [Bacteroidia bacterium]
MELQKFITNFAEQFEDTKMSEFSKETVFSELEEWSSMTLLSIIAMVDEEYEVTLKGDDIRSVTTIEDLFKLVKSRK